MEQASPVQDPVAPAGLADSQPGRERLWTPLGIKTHALVAGALLFIIAATFSNSYKSGMALDNRYIIEEYYRTLLQRDPNHEIVSWRQIGYFFSQDYWWPKGISGLYRPITSLSYWLDYAILTGKAPKRDYEGKVLRDRNGVFIREDTWEKMTWLEYVNAPGQLNTASYHTINLLLHWSNALMIYFISLILLDKLWPAAFVAGLFAVHPITTESVTNIIGRADIFAAMSTFGALLLYIRSLDSRGWERAPWLIAIVVVLFIGFLAKESSVAVGAIIPLYWFTYRYRWDKLKVLVIGLVTCVVAAIAFNNMNKWAAASVTAAPVVIWAAWVFISRTRDDWKPLAIEFLVWCVMLPPLLGMYGLRQWVFANATPAEEPFLDNPIRGMWLIQELNIPSFEQQLLEKPMLGMSYLECKMTAVKIMGKLMALLVWPQTLCCDYSFDQIPNFSFTFQQGWDDWEAVLALAVILGIFALAGWLLMKGQKAAFFYIAFFFLAALPTSNFIITIGSVMAERFMYLPLMGFTGSLVIGAFSLGRYVWTKLKLDRPDVPRWSLIVGELLAVIIVVYGIRGYRRNEVWQNDLTLWEDAIQTSPKSFRSHQSLSFALYERFMTNEYHDLNRIINVDIDAIPIIEKLPNHLNSARLYLHLGMYLLMKGDLLSQSPEAPGKIVVTPQTAPIFVQALELLETGVKIDRAFNEVNRAKQIQRNDPEERLVDVGLAPLYGTLGDIYERLGRTDVALVRYEYQRHLDPTETEPYLRMARAYKELKQNDQAAVALIQAMLLDNRKTDIWAELMEIYRRIGPAAATAIVSDGKSPRLNITENPIAETHLKEAYKGLIRIGRRTKRTGIAEDSWTTAVLKGDFKREEFDPIFKEELPIITPEGTTYPSSTGANPQEPTTREAR